MPSRGWKLSAALGIALASSSPCLAEGIDPAFNKAMACTMVAATVYAQTLEETAEAVARMAQLKCQGDWKIAEAKARRDAIAELEKLVRRPLTPEQKAQVSYTPRYPPHVTPEIEMRVGDMRARAKISGPGVYAETRERFLVEMRRD